MADEHNRPRTKLLLHCVDGTFPYLTPNLLKSCFPAAKVSDLLLLGQSVRDTCVAPIGFRDNDKSKPRGYTFSGSIKSDHWLLPYSRVTVPSFDYLNDDARGKNTERQQVDLQVSNKRVMVWTPNGRIPLSPELYFKAAMGLENEFVVPLFDDIPENNTKPKRTKQAVQRTTQWGKDFLSRKHDEKTKIWIPVNIDDTEATEDRVKDALVMIQQGASGLTLIGWDRLSERRSVLRKTVDLSETSTECVVLTTPTLLHLLEACSIAGHVTVGCELPTKWASQEKAFSLSLDNVEKQTRKRKRGEKETQALNSDGCIDLSPSETVSQHPWFRDKGPLLEGCSCMTCQRHTRAYVYHLVCAKELLANILLFVHNLHHTLGLVRLFNDQTTPEDREEVYEYLKSQTGGIES